MTAMVRYVLVLGVAALLPACDGTCSTGDAGAVGEQCEGAGDDVVAGGCRSINNPDVSIQGYMRFTPAQKQNNPEAEESSYVYLAAGREAVVLDGPTVTNEGPLALHDAGIVDLSQRPESPYVYEDAYKVVVNDSLGYEIRITDFEGEVMLARVELCVLSGPVHSLFIFGAAPHGDGVAHDVTITAVVNGVSLAPATPYTIEVR
jgi:hypothetical protein